MSSVIGAKIRQYRRLRGITQEQLGSLVGVTTQAVSKWERGGTPVSTSLIAKNTGLSHDRADEWMKMLCNVNLADCSVIATENGEINSYTFRQESSLIPLLCFADEICQRGIIDYLTQFERKTPLFKPMV